MSELRYLINLYYSPKHARSHSLVNINGATYSMPTYEGGYYVASIPELKVTATASNYSDALDNVLNAATASNVSNFGQEPLSNIKNW